MKNARLIWHILSCCCIALTGMLITANVAMAQVAAGQQMVRGVITDEEGNALPGVTVTIEGSTKGVIADENGRFSIEAPAAAKLVFTFIGMETLSVPVNGRKQLDVQLKRKKDTFDEVTVVAFATQKKESVVGAITTIKPSELKVPSSNLTTALAGRIAGMVAYQRSGEPGQDNADFFIRGVTSFGYSNRPLILVDGVEVPASELARLQVDDIASFSIMKDASATSLYGARGANGVILITTKEGKEGKASVTLRLENSISSPTREPELADPVTYMELANEAVRTRGRGLSPFSQEKIANTKAGLHPLLYPATDWKQMLLRNNVINNRANLNVSGGGKVARYYVAATYNKDNGLLKVDKRNNFNNNISLKTYGLRSNVNINLTKTTEAIVRLNTTWSDYSGPINGGADVYKQIMRTSPVLYPAYYLPDANNLSTRHILFGNYDAGQYSNPYADVMRGYRDYTNAMMLAQFELKQDLSFITKGLKASGMYNTTRYNYYTVTRNYNPFYYNIGTYDKNTGAYTLTALNPTVGTEYLGYTEGQKDVSTENYFQGILSYDKEINSRNTVNAMLVYTMLNKLEANAGTLQNSLPHRNMGLAGRFTYALANKYFLEANFGYNGSERFYKSHRFGFFPSIGGAWYISREPFWERFSKTVSNLKLRGTYGLVGNDAIGSPSERFFFLSEVNMNSAAHGYTFGSEFGYTPSGIVESRYENRNISWETAKKMNLSAEIGLFGFINIIADVYKESRSNILMTRSHIPNTMGLVTLPKANVGAATSKGFDLSVEMNKQFSKHFFLSGRGNFTYATSAFTTYEEPDYSAAPWKSRIGYPLGQSWGYVAERLFVDDKEVRNSPAQAGEVMGGDIKFKDINKDGRIDALDQVPIGYPTTPEIVYGFGLSAGYRNFDISCFFQGLARESFWIDPVATAPFIGAEGSSNQLLKVYADNHWSEEDRNIYALWPRLSDVSNTNNSAISTWFMRDGTFLRLKQLELGYTIPEAAMKRVGMSKLRIYANGANLFSFSKFKLWDPEMAGNGLGYPLQRIINFGIQCSL